MLFSTKTKDTILSLNQILTATKPDNNDDRMMQGEFSNFLNLCVSQTVQKAGRQTFFMKPLFIQFEISIIIPKPQQFSL